MPQKCRDCKWWVPIPPWQGNCKLRPTEKPQWSESAAPCQRGCNSFECRVTAGVYRDGKLVEAI